MGQAVMLTALAVLLLLAAAVVAAALSHPRVRPHRAPPVGRTGRRPLTMVSRRRGCGS
jgi:hypothetical protein